MKRWASESPIEGWFRRTRAERIGWNVVLLRITKSPEKHLTLLIGPTGRASTADAGCQTFHRQRGGAMCLDSLPHGRNFKAPSLCPDRLAAPQTVGQDPRSLCVLRNHRKLAQPLALSLPTAAVLAPMALASVSPWRSHVGGVWSPGGTVPVASGVGYPLPLPSRGESIARGAGCVNRARPDLWGAGGCNDPGPPDVVGKKSGFARGQRS
jgi:hypothetical protein